MSHLEELKKFFAGAAALVFLCSCVAPLSSVHSLPSPGIAYQNSDCVDVASQLRVTSEKLNDYTKRHETNRYLDVGFAVGALPTIGVSLIGLAFTQDYSNQIAGLRGQKEALLLAAQRKSCQGS